MTGLDIEAIRARLEWLDDSLDAVTRNPGPVTASGHLAAAIAAAKDVPALLAEIERLSAALLEEQTVHAKTFDNFEAHVESYMEQNTRQLDRYARLDAAHDRLRKAHKQLQGWNDELKAERDALALKLLDARFGIEEGT